MDLARTALAAHKSHGVPGDGRVLGRVEAHSAVGTWTYSISNSSVRPERSVRGRCFCRRWLK